MKPLLLSFCNTTTPRYSLATFDFESGNLKWLPLPASPISGITGICFTSSEHEILVVYQGVAPGDPLIQKISLVDNLATSLDIGTVLDPHSICRFKNGYLLADSASNQILFIEVTADHRVLSQSTYWSYGENESDLIHLNSVTSDGNRVFASCFGLRESEGDGWSGLGRGEIFEVIDNKNTRTICGNLKHPHSLIYRDETLYWAESATSSVFQADIEGSARKIITLTGYLRGISFDGSTMYIGSSTKRRQSRLTGTLKNYPPASEDELYAWIYRLNLESLEYDRRDVTLYGDEIYDLVVYNGTHLGCFSSVGALHPASERMVELESRNIELQKKL